MHVLLLTQGAHAPYLALTLNRVALGVFFAISGYHKLFNASRHAALTRTLQDDGVHGLPHLEKPAQRRAVGRIPALDVHPSHHAVTPPR